MCPENFWMHVLRILLKRNEQNLMGILTNDGKNKDYDKAGCGKGSKENRV